MPAPGDQYGGVKNPFEERVVNGFTAVEIATLQSRLNKQLGPEYISQRTGHGGGKVAYLEGNKAIALANEVFGFNGWSSSLGQVQIDYVDENPQNGKINLGLSIVVRITLKDGTFHEDIGYGSDRNNSDKAKAFEKAKKEAATDGLKRALRTFGNVLGNCLYDKEYLKKVQKIHVKPVKFKEDNLFRHPDFAPQLKEETAVIKREPNQTPVRTNQILRTRTEALNQPIAGEFDDEFDGNLFDGVEITEHQGEEFTFETISASDEATLKDLEGAQMNHASSRAASNRNTPIPTGAPSRPPNARVQTAPVQRAQNGAQQPAPQNQQQQNGPGRPPMPPNSRGPQTPIQQGAARTDMNRPRMPPPTVDIHAAPKPQNPQQQSNQTPQQPPQNQPLRPTPPQGQPPTQAQQPKPGAPITTTNAPPTHRPPVGFVTSRAAELVQNSDSSSSSFTSLPAFNPHAESPLPKEQRTPGLDHTRSVPIKREALGAAPAPPVQNPGAAGAVPSAGANAGAGAGFNRPAMGPRGANTNFVNPQQDTMRRIGMPAGGGGAGGGGAMSPVGRGSKYKPPMKRPPLQDVSNQSGNGSGLVGEPEAKRQKVEKEVAGVENAAAGAAGAGVVSS